MASSLVHLEQKIKLLTYFNQTFINKHSPERCIQPFINNISDIANTSKDF